MKIEINWRKYEPSTKRIVAYVVLLFTGLYLFSNTEIYRELCYEKLWSRDRDVVYEDVARIFGKQVCELTNEDCKNVEELCLTYPITNIKQLANFRNLKKLQILLSASQDKIQLPKWLPKFFNDFFGIQKKHVNIKAIGRLKNLQELQIGGDVTDVAPLVKLKNLKLLRFRNIDVNSIKSLEKLSQLTSLDCNNTNIRDLTPLEKLINLQSLYLSSTQIHSLDALMNLTSLRELDIGLCGQINDVTPLANLTNLAQLRIDHTPINDINALMNLKNLTNLDLKYCYKITDIKPISNLINLQRLDLSYTKVNDISPLVNLTNLQALRLHRTPVSNIELLFNLMNLQYIDIGFTDVSDKQRAELKKALPNIKINGEY